MNLNFARRLLFVALLALFCVMSAPAQTRPVKWEPKRTWVFFAGLLQWKDPQFGSFPQKNRRDAILLDVLRERGVPESQIVYLQDKAATTGKIERTLAAHLSQAQPGDWVFVYYCGHGFKIDNDAYLASYDAGGKSVGWAVNAVPQAIEKYFKGDYAFIALDNCYSGAMAEAVKQYGKRVSYAVMASSYANSSSTGNWTFTESLIYAWRGAPHVDANADGQISLRETQAGSESDMLFGEEQMPQFLFTGALAPQLGIATADGPAAPRVGERIEALSEGSWYKGIVLEARDGEFRVHYYGYEEDEDEWVTASQLRPAKLKQLPHGAIIEAESEGKWYPAQVLDVRGGVYLVSYDGFDSEWDEWVAPSRVRLRHHAAYRVGEEVSVEWKGDWYRAKIIQLRSGSARIHYVGYDKSWDEWAELKRIKLRSN